MSVSEVTHPPDTGTLLAIERTRLASDRTLMAWVRTAFSMISFGFTLYKFFQYLQEDLGHPGGLRGPRNLGLLLIALGVLSLAAASWQYASSLRRLARLSGERPSGQPLPLLVALAVVLLGLVAFLGLTLRIGPLGAGS
jgi:putative membrane protein